MTLTHALATFRTICDAAVIGPQARILVDFSAADGDLSTEERYELGSSLAAYYRSKALPFRVAVVGNLPLINGHAAKVFSNHGITARTFHKREDGVYWLNDAARCRVRMPIVGIIAEGQQASVITIPAEAVIEIIGNPTRDGLIEVRWSEGRVNARVFCDDMAACCEEFQEPDFPEH